MNMVCARIGKNISPGECSDIIVKTQAAADLRICQGCERGKLLHLSVLRFAAEGSAGHDANSQTSTSQQHLEASADTILKAYKEKIMKNTLADLNNHLFAQLERLSDESLSPEKLSHEITRSKAIADLSREVISNAALVLKAHALATSGTHGDLPKMLEGGK